MNFEEYYCTKGHRLTMVTMKRKFTMSREKQVIFFNFYILMDFLALLSNKQFYQFNDEEVTPIKSLHGKKKASDDKETKYVANYQ